MDARSFAYDVLLLSERQHIFINLYLQENPDFAALDQRDQDLAYHIITGVETQKLFLDYQIDNFLSNPKKLALPARIILRIAAYQHFFLTQVPDYAIVDEAVNMAKERGLGKLAKLINAVARKIVKLSTTNYPLPDGERVVEYLAVKYSHPHCFVQRYLERLGMEETEKLLISNNRIVATPVRVDTNKISLAEAKLQLEKDCYKVEVGNLTPEYSLLVQPGNIVDHSLFMEGKITIQDQGAVLAGLTLNPQKGERILDMCAAPGGKTTLIAQLTQNQAEIVAVDISSQRVEELRSVVKRMVSAVKVHVMDATQPEILKLGLFDRILLDAPCSGLGTIRSKPEIRWRIGKEDILALAEVQRKLIDQAAKLLRPGGTLVYVTCSNEAEETSSHFIAPLENGLEFIEGHQLFPHLYDSEGFYIATLQKRK